MNREELLKNAKPILFNTEMVQAILEGRKTVTRRIMKPQPLFKTSRKYIFADETCPKKFEDCDNIFDVYQYQVGDILYVRETWGNWSYDNQESNAVYYQYRADYPSGAKTYMYDEAHECDLPKWHPSIHMPKEAARIFLKVTDVRVERLQDVTEEQAIKEGIGSLFLDYIAYSGDLKYSVPMEHETLAIEQFELLWDSINLKRGYGWETNPWVWVIEFERVEVN